MERSYVNLVNVSGKLELVSQSEMFIKIREKSHSLLNLRRTHGLDSLAEFHAQLSIENSFWFEDTNSVLNENGFKQQRE